DPDQTEPNAAVVKTYIYGDGKLLAQHDGHYDEPIYFYLLDRLGSVRQIVDDSGTVVNSYTDDPFGRSFASETQETITNPFRFAGYYWDVEIAQYFCNARQYD